MRGGLSRALPYAQYRKLDLGSKVVFADINEERARRYLASQKADMKQAAGSRRKSPPC